jgi:hypothetical protein
LTEIDSLARLLPLSVAFRGRSRPMQELMWYALSQGLTRSVPVQDVPVWFAALLLLGLLCAGVLIGSSVLAALKAAKA